MPQKLYYTEKGYGTPLVLLHGNGEDSGYFVNQIDYFAAKYRVIAVDTRGHGRSPRGSAPFTLETFADDLKALADSLKIKNFYVLGFSDGGNIALEFTLKYPEYVSRLVLCGANLFPKGLKTAFLLPVKILCSFFSLTSHFSRKAVRRKELLALMAKAPDIQPEELASINCPVLVIAGTHDLIKEKHTRLIANSIKNSQLCFLSGDHGIARKNSVEFNRTVEIFLEKPF